MGLDFDKEIKKIIEEKKSIKPKELYERDRLRRKEDLYICNLLNKTLNIKLISIYDLINNPNIYEDKNKLVTALLEILKKHKIKDYSIKEGIIRALTRKESKGLVEQDLIKEYKLLDFKEKEYIGWIIGNAIEHIYSDQYFNEIIDIAKNKENGISRQMFVLALAKTKKYKMEAIDTLINLTYDDDVDLQAMEALIKLKAHSAKERIVELAKSSKKPIQKKAITYLKKMGYTE